MVPWCSGAARERMALRSPEMPSDEAARPTVVAIKPALGWARRRLGLPALFTALALLMVRPRPGRLPDNLGDPALVIWIMSWVGEGIVSQPTRLFDAPMLWPNGSTLVHSDVLATPALPYWALYQATGSWAASLAGVTLLFVVLAEAGAYLLALRVTGRRDAAIVAAVAFAFSGFALGRLPTPHLTSIGILALCLVAFLRLLDQPTLKRGLLLGAAILLTFYASSYYGAIAVLLLALLSPAMLAIRAVRRAPGTARLLAGLAMAAIVAGIGVAPTVLASRRLQDDVALERPLDPQYDLVARDLVRPVAGSYLWDRVRDPVPVGYEHQFFPGALAAVLGGAGIVAVAARVARRRPVGPADRPHAGRDLTLLGVAGAVSVSLAAGSAGIGPFAPWKLVHAYVPGFSAIRATSRLAVPALLVGAVFAAVGYAAVTQRLRARRPLAVAALVAAVAVMLFDLSVARSWAPLDTSNARLAVYRALDARPAGPVLELPVPDQRVDPLAWVYTEAPRLVYSTVDWNPRVNGYSGFLPPGYHEDFDAYRRFPEPVAVDRLRARGVRYVVLHVGMVNRYPGLSEGDAADRLGRLPPGATSTREGASYLVDLGPPEPLR